MAHSKRFVLRVFALAALALCPTPVRAAEGPASAPAPTWADFNKLQAEVREQRQLLIQLMQTEQQRYDMLLRLVQGGPAPSSGPAAPTAAAAADGPGVRAGTTLASTAPRTAEPERERRTATLEGKVSVPGRDLSDVYVYVDNVKAPPVRGRTMEIKQEDKQFIPRVAVVQVGTTLLFPNLDPIFHNVFSNSARNTFDLGSYRAGDKPRAAVMSAPGVVDIYCNMHQRMSANVLVVPSRLYAKVRPDGSFRIDNVPVGARTVVAWSPSLKPAQLKVELGPDGGRVAFAMEYTEHRSHVNKFGQPYGSYKE